MASRDLTSLADVKSWLGITDSAKDALLELLISATSSDIGAYLGRQSIAPASYDEVFDGPGAPRLVLRKSPLLSVSRVLIGGFSVPSAQLSPTAAGFVYQAWDGDEPGSVGIISLRGYAFSRGIANVEVQYRAGYETSDTATIPASSPYAYTVSGDAGAWLSDSSVSFVSGGAALTKVASAPVAGQYSVSGGVYTFAAADAGKAVMIAYGYVPRPLARACVEIVAERFRYRDRIGHRSKSMAGQETVSYDNEGFSSYAKTLLRPFNTVALVL